MTVDTSELTRVGRIDLLRIVEELKEENAGLRVQAKLDRVDELQARMSEMVNNQLSRRVRAFHLKFGHPVNNTPVVPVDDQVRFRLQLIREEFEELVNACLDTSSIEVFPVGPRNMEHCINTLPVRVDLPEAYDALLDMSWVIEGTHAVLGTDAEPGFAEVARANMEKEPADVAAADAAKRGERIKPTKPEGWVPPRITDVLCNQGWKP